MTLVEILLFVARFMGFLWRDARFRIAGSQVSVSNGGDSVLDIESSELRMRVVRDRGQLFLDIQPATQTKEWFSVDIVMRMITGIPRGSAELDEDCAVFLDVHLDEIRELFSPGNWTSTMSALKKIEKQRSKDLFG